MTGNQYNMTGTALGIIGPKEEQPMYQNPLPLDMGGMSKEVREAIIAALDGWCNDTRENMIVQGCVSCQNIQDNIPNDTSSCAHYWPPDDDPDFQRLAIMAGHPKYTYNKEE